MKLWIDDIREPPDGYLFAQTVNDAISIIKKIEYDIIYYRHNSNGYNAPNLELIDIDHDAGEYAKYGGDYIKLLDWLEETNRNYPIRIHSMNPVGRENMRAIIRRNGWTEVM